MTEDLDSVRVNKSWYEIVEATDEIYQGDLIDKFPVVNPDIDGIGTYSDLTNSDYFASASVEYHRVVVLTQSCDLANDDVTADTPVVYCPTFDAASTKFSGKIINKDMWNKLQKGQLRSKHLLSRSILEKHPLDYQVVDLSRVYSLPYGFVREYVNSRGCRLRLKSPYRESLSQAFASQYARVALDSPIPTEFPYTPKDIQAALDASSINVSEKIVVKDSGHVSNSTASVE